MDHGLRTGSKNMHSEMIMESVMMYFETKAVTKQKGK